jgi:hypothetical protein
VEFTKGNTSSDSLKGNEKVIKPQHPRRSRDIKCLGHGHIASECPNKRVMILHGDHEELISGDEVETEDEDMRYKWLNKKRISNQLREICWLCNGF